jgi:hypothetical protein
MIEDRVKKTIDAKDLLVSDLRNRIEELQIRNGQLELLLERQRKEFILV